MPGPVWLFGAYGVVRIWNWHVALVFRCTDSVAGFWPAGWRSALIDAGGLLAALLPLWLLWLLVRRSSYAVPLLKWYAGIMAAVFLVSIFSPIFSDSFEIQDIVRSELLRVVWCILWFGLLRYLERSEDMATLFPEQNKRYAWLFALPVIALSCVYA